MTVQPGTAVTVKEMGAAVATRQAFLFQRYPDDLAGFPFKAKGKIWYAMVGGVWVGAGYRDSSGGLWLHLV
jgi:hypothetical protein